MAIRSARCDALSWKKEVKKKNQINGTTSNGSHDDADDDVFELNVPATIDTRQLTCLVTSDRFVLPY